MGGDKVIEALRQIEQGKCSYFSKAAYAGTGRRSIMNIFENAVRVGDRPVTTPARVRHPIGLQRILAPTDLTPDGRKAVEYAVALAECFDAQLTPLHVYDAPGLYDYAQESNGCSLAELIRRNAQNDLDALCSEIKEEYPRTDTHLRCGVPAEEIVAAAKDLDVDLIVISTHNYNWLTHLIRGSDAEQVLRHAPCPIMVVRKHEHDFVTATTAGSNREL